MPTKLDSRPLIAISAPSGGGKTTLVKGLLSTRSDLCRVITSTTRFPREGERHGIDYFFYSQTQFLEKIRRGEFVEFDKFAGNFYGTERKAVKTAGQEGKLPIAALTLRGVASFRNRFPSTFGIFLMPKNMADLKQRLKRRPDSDSAEIVRRMEHAREEVSSWQESCQAAVVIVNGHIGEVVADVAAIISAYLARQIKVT